MPTSTRTTIDAAFPATERILGWIDDLASLGHRRTGTPQGRRSAEYIADSFRKAGLVNVTTESAPTECPTVFEQEFEVAGTTMDCFWANGTGRSTRIGRSRTAHLDAEVIHLGAGWEGDFEDVDVAGKIVVCDIEFHPSTISSVLERHPRAEVYDPAGTFAVARNKFDIFSPLNWPWNFFRAQQAGAIGFVGVLQNYMDHVNFNEDYSEMGVGIGIPSMHIPGVWVSRASGAQIVAALAQDPGTRASLTVDVEYEIKDALNVHGTLPGQDDGIILIHSHHDAVFNGAVQDASGIAEVLALAHCFAGLPQDERPQTMMFAATDTHFTGYEGHRDFIARREASHQELLIDLCIEHVGKEVELDADNRAVETGDVEPRLVYVSDQSGLLTEVREIFAEYGLTRSIFLPVDTQRHDPNSPYEFRPDEVISDAYYFDAAGVPVVSMVSAQMYLFHPSDTIDRVPHDQLRPVGLAFAAIAHAAAHRLSAHHRPTGEADR